MRTQQKRIPYQEADTGGWVDCDCPVCDGLLDEQGNCAACAPVLPPPTTSASHVPVAADPWGTAPLNPIGEPF